MRNKSGYLGGSLGARLNKTHQIHCIHSDKLAAYVYNISKVELCALALDSLINFQHKIQRIALSDLTKVGWNRVSPTYFCSLS